MNKKQKNPKNKRAAGFQVQTLASLHFANPCTMKINKQLCSFIEVIELVSPSFIKQNKMRGHFSSDIILFVMLSYVFLIFKWYTNTFKCCKRFLK